MALLMITILNKGEGNVASQTIQCDGYMQALSALAKEAMEAGLDATPVIYGLMRMGPDLAITIKGVTFSNVFPEKKKYPETFHFHPKTEEDVLDFYKNFKGLISEDMFDAKVKHVNLYNIQMTLPA